MWVINRVVGEGKRKWGRLDSKFWRILKGIWRWGVGLEDEDGDEDGDGNRSRNKKFIDYSFDWLKRVHIVELIDKFIISIDIFRFHLMRGRREGGEFFKK